jgi:hypothetical protein
MKVGNYVFLNHVGMHFSIAWGLNPRLLNMKNGYEFFENQIGMHFSLA